MSKAGEITNLSKLIKPHIGVITNIGEAYIENFKNLAGIAKAKSEILDNIETGGIAILNRDDQFFSYLSKKVKLRKLRMITWENKGSDICLKKILKRRHISKVFINIKKILK